MAPTRQVPRLVGAVLLSAVFAVLAAYYIRSISYFEGTDEYHHFRFAQRLLEERRLPIVDASDASFAGEGHQPPLYYAVVATAASVLLAVDLPQRLGLSEMAVLLYTGRVISAIAGLVAVLGIYALGRRLFPRRPQVAWGAAALAVLTPTFVGQSSILSNDSSTAAVGTALLALCAGALGERPPTRRYLLLVGLVAGAGLLVKVSLLYVGVPVAASLAAIAWRKRSWLDLVSGLLLVGLPALLVAGWWYVRNWLLYGDLLAWGLNGRLNPGNVYSAIPPLDSFLALIPSVWESLWFAFGGVGQLRAPLLLNAAFWLLLALAGLGMLQATRGWRRGGASDWPEKAVLLGPFVLALVVGGLAIFRYHASYVGAGHGRYLYPVVGPIMVFLARGLAELHTRAGLSALQVVGAGLAVLVVATPPVALAPAVPRPTAVDAASLSILAQPLEVTFADGIRLLGYRLETPIVRPGESVDVSLYWQSVGGIRTNWTFYVHLLDASNVLRAQYDSVPLHGAYPALFWRPGQIWAERYTLAAPANAAPGLYHLQVGLYDLQTGRQAPAVTGKGDRLGGGVLFGQLRVKGAPEVFTPGRRTQIVFEEGIQLAGWDWNGRRLTLYWQSAGRPSRSYTVFTHLLDPEGKVVAQHDGPPAGGTLPTDLWEEGDQIRDEHDVSPPPGRYTLAVGLYELSTGRRLAVRSGGFEARLGTVSVPE